MPSLPAFTVIVTGYNQSKFIGNALASVLNQDYAGDIEYIFSDDCSQDNTFAIMQEAAASYQGPRPIVLNRNTTNLNIGTHIEKLYAMASHPWIVRMDGDDMSMPYRCALIAEAIQQFPQARYVISDAVVHTLGKNESIDYQSYPFKSVKPVLNAEVCTETRAGSFLGGGTSAILKDARLGDSSLNLGEDLLEAQNAWLNQGLIRIKNPLIVYVEHNLNVSRINRKLKNNDIASFYAHMEKLKLILDKDITAHRKIIDFTRGWLKANEYRLDNKQTDIVKRDIELRIQDIEKLQFNKDWPDMSLKNRLKHYKHLQENPWRLLPTGLYARLICLLEKIKSDR